MKPAILLPLAAAGLAVALVGCGDSAPQASDPSAAPAESTATATYGPDDVCPPKLAIGDDPDGHGFGTQEDAEERPTLPAPEQVWTCRYDPVEAGQTPNGGTEFAWVLSGAATEATGPQVAALATALEEVRPFAGADRACTADLGPRWLVVYPGDNGLVGVVVDDFGCREVRLTDDPASVPPGAGAGDGTVPGVLDGGTDVLTALGLGRAG